jgi:hypothetical protein
MDHPDHPRHSRRLPAKVLVPLDTVRTHLALVWLVGALLIAGLLFLRSLVGAYADLTQQVWGWFLPTVMPTLAMIFTVWGQTALDPVLLDSVARKDFFRVALWLSVVYLVAVMVVILIKPPGVDTGVVISLRARRAIELMHTSNLWLGPFQGLVASVLGVLFVSAQQKDGNRT